MSGEVPVNNLGKEADEERKLCVSKKHHFAYLNYLLRSVYQILKPIYRCYALGDVKEAGLAEK